MLLYLPDEITSMVNLDILIGSIIERCCEPNDDIRQVLHANDKLNYQLNKRIIVKYFSSVEFAGK